MNQEETNAEWRKELGTVGLLVQPRHVTPGLRKPYEWVLDWDQIDALVMALRVSDLKRASQIEK